MHRLAIVEFAYLMSQVDLLSFYMEINLVHNCMEAFLCNKFESTNRICFRIFELVWNILGKWILV